jgi:myo-inositol-1(or 4)-monophosphatase
MDLENLCTEVMKLVRETGQYVYDARVNFESNHETIESKGHSNFVTSVDKTSERKLVEGLTELLPESGFIAEEGTSDKIGDVYNWVIDPIDGTTNFIHGVSPYSISIALQRGKQIVLGVVYEIPHCEMFYAWEGSPAFLNGKPISVSKAENHNEALVVTGFPYYDFGLLDEYMQCLKFLWMNTRGVRRLGSAAIDLCYVACGRFDAFWEYGLHPWDVAAGTFIIQQAGGKITDFDGHPDFMQNGNIVATNTNYYNNFYEIVNKFLGGKNYATEKN